jgi:hypothetical protein
LLLQEDSQQDVSLGESEAPETLPHARSALPKLQNLRGLGGWVASLEVRPPRVLLQMPRASALRPQPNQRFVGNDAMQPGGKPGIPTEVGRMPQGLFKGGLDNVFGRRGVAREAPRRAYKPWSKLLIERAKLRGSGAGSLGRARLAHASVFLRVARAHIPCCRGPQDSLLQFFYTHMRPLWVPGRAIRPGRSEVEKRGGAASPKKRPEKVARGPPFKGTRAG